MMFRFRFDRTTWFVRLLVVAVGSTVNCDRRVHNAFDGPKSTLESMDAAVDRQDWQSARQWADAVLFEHGEDSDRSVKVARVGFLCQKLDRAIGLLADASRGDGFAFSNERIIRLGLGAVSTSVDAEVQWPDGGSDTYRPLRPNTQWLLTQHEEAFETTAN